MATRYTFTDDVGDVRLSGFIEPAPGGSQTAAATFTTDPVTFIGEHVFDLGRVATVFISATLLSAAADGETFGSAPGTINIDVNQIAASRDNLLYNGSGGIQTNPPFIEDDPWYGIGESGALPKETHQQLQVVARYLRVRTQVQDSNFDVYAGANHPSGTYRVDLEYV